MTDQTDNRNTGSVEPPNINDEKSVAGYGLKAQQQLADFSANLLDQLRSIKTGDIEYPLDMLMQQVQKVSLSGFTGNGQNSPRLMRKAKKMLTNYSKADNRIFELEMQLDAIKGDLMRDVVRLDKLKAKNLEHRQVLKSYIAAGEKALSQLKAKQKQKHTLDSENTVHALEMRVHDLKLAHTIAMQTDPQVALIQKTNRALIERIQTSLLNTIPLWRNQMTLASTLLKQKNLMDMEKQLSQVATGNLKNGAEALKQAIARGENPLTAVQQAGETLAETIGAVKSAYDSGETDIASALTAIETLKKQSERI